jgi:hypothetical protein
MITFQQISLPNLFADMTAGLAGNWELVVITGFVVAVITFCALRFAHRHDNDSWDPDNERK